MQICPGADPGDGLLDVTIGGALPRRKVLGLMPKVYRGTHVERAEVQVVRTTGLRIESAAINAYADGEYLGPLPVEVTVVPAAVHVLVP
jgi:diacylglycerol kinase (ATP)